MHKRDRNGKTSPGHSLLTLEVPRAKHGRLRKCLIIISKIISEKKNLSSFKLTCCFDVDDCVVSDNFM